jgi:hypothetical protein
MNYLFKVLVVVALACILLSSANVVLAGNPSQLRILIPATGYTEENPDDWTSESYVTSLTEFTLSIHCKNTGSVPNSSELHLLVASNIVDDGNFTVFVNGTQINISNNIIGLAAGDNSFGIDYSALGGGGIYPTYFQDVNLDMTINRNETVDVPIRIKLISGGTNPMIHFDAVGIIDKQVVLINPKSGDAAYNVPEFPTIALPMLSILGLMFIMSRKRK